MYARTAYEHSHKAQQYRNERRESQALKLDGNVRQQQRRELRRELERLEG